MKFGIVTFPGSNCDYDAYHAVVDALGEEAFYIWHKDHDLRGVHSGRAEPEPDPEQLERGGGSLD